MNKIKLFSALAMGTLAMTIAAPQVSAQVGVSGGDIEITEDTTVVLPPSVVDPGTELPDTIFPGGQKPGVTNPGVEIPTGPEYPNVIVPGPAGALALTQYPKSFNFGSHAVDATINFDASIYSFEQEAGSMDFSQYSQGVQVQDGRMNNHDWHLTADLSGFANLAGATITLENTNLQIQNGSAKKGSGFSNDVFEINGTAKSLVAADPKAKGYTSLFWNSASDVKFNVSGQNIRTGAHSGTITWTLNATPEA